MTSHSDASADLHTHAKFAVQHKVRLGKTEERTLILTSYCFHAQYNQGVPPKTIVKTEFTIPFIEISALENVNPDEIAFSLTDQRHLTYVAPASDVSSIISHIMMSMTNHFPEIDVEERLIALKVSDTDRLAAIRNAVQTRRARIEGSPCGSFRETYDYFCKYFNSPKRDEIVWDIETVYHTQNNKTLTLRDFDHVDSKDLLPVIAAVSFSGWFNALDASGIRLTPEAQVQVLNVLKRNKQLTSLVLDNCFLKNDFFSKMPASVDSTSCALRHLDLSNNAIGDAGVVALSGLFTKLRLSLECLVLTGCGMSARGANRLAEAFAGSIRDLKAPLTHLDLSGNSLKGEELSQFFNFLANQNSLAVLDLSKSDCCIDALSVSLSRGCTQHLRVLRLSGNPFFTTRKACAVNDSWRRFFTTTIALEELYLSSCRLPLEALRLLLTGLTSNRALSGLLLDISSNDFRTGGAADVLLGSLSKLPMLSSLDLSDNEMNMDMLKVLDALATSHHIKHLKIGANYGALKSRQIIEVMEKLTRLIQSPTSAIESLSLADSKLRGDLTILLNELSSNPSLVTLDISGNLMGDVGLRILSRILVLNTHLRELAWDRNCLSLQSLEEVAKALEHNHTLQFLKLPATDLGPLMQRNPEKTTALIAKIETALAKNHGLRKVSTDRAFKLHQGIASSSSHQLIDKLIVQLDTRCSRLLAAKAEDLSEEAKLAVSEARSSVNDAQAAKRLLASLQADAISLEDGRDTPVARGLSCIPGKLQEQMNEQVKRSVESMLNLARSQCGFVDRDESLCESLQSECEAKCQLAPRFLDTLVQCTLSTGLANKLAELDLTSAAHISDRILDEAIRHLDLQHRTVHRFEANLVTVRRRRKLAAESVSSINSNSPFDESEEDNVLPELQTINKNGPSRACRPRSTFAIVEASDNEKSDNEEVEDVKKEELKKELKEETKKETKKNTEETKEESEEEAEEDAKEESKEKTKEDAKEESKEKAKEDAKEESGEETKEETKEEPKKEPKAMPEEELSDVKEEEPEPRKEPQVTGEGKKRREKGRAPSPPTSPPPAISGRLSFNEKEEEPVRKERTRTLPSPSSMPPTLSPKRPQSLGTEGAEAASRDKGSRSSTASGSTEDLLDHRSARHSSGTSLSVASRSQDSLDSTDLLSPFAESPSALPSAGHRPLTHLARSRPKRPRTHRPTKANATGDSVIDDMFTAATAEPGSEDEEAGASGTRTERKESNAKESPEGADKSDKKRSRSSKGLMKSMLKHLPSKDKHKRGPSKEAESEQPPLPPPTELPVEESSPPARPVPRKPQPMMPAFSLADIMKKREDLRSGATTESQPQPPPPPKLPSPKTAQPPTRIANWIEQGKPDTPSSPKPKPNFMVPTLRPVTLREKDPKSAAQTAQEQEKRLSVRERAANFAPSGVPPAPPPKPRKPASLRASQEPKPQPPEKPSE